MLIANPRKSRDFRGSVSCELFRIRRSNNGDVIDCEKLMKAGLAGKSADGLKILGNGEIGKKLTVRAAAFTAAAKEKIEAAGGKAEVI